MAERQIQPCFKPQSYEKSFVDFHFGQGAALSNILIAISFVFAIFYLRSTRRAVDE